MRPVRASIAPGLALALTVSLAGCPLPNKSTLDPNPRPSSGVAGTPAALAGTLKGSVTGAGATRMALIETSTNEVTMVDLADGRFASEVKAGKYAVTLLDANNQPVGLLVQQNASLFEIKSGTDLGSMTWDAAKKTLTTLAPLTTVAPLSTVAPYRTAAAGDLDLTDMLSLKPEAANDGANAVDVSKILAEGKGDADGDKVPDFLDNDSNANGVFDNLEGLNSSAVKLEPATDLALLGALKQCRPVVFDNLKLQAHDLGGDGDDKPYTNQHVLAVHLGVPPTLASTIAKVQLVHAPSWIKGTVENAAGGYNFASGTYPSVGSSWGATGYEVPLASQGGQSIYSIWVRSSGDPTPGLVTFKVTLTSGAVAYLTTRLFYAFNTPPKVLTINGTPVTYPTAEGQPGTMTNPFNLGVIGNNVTMTANRPLNAVGGVPIVGMGVQAHIFPVNSSGQQIQTSAEITNPVQDSGPYHTPLSLSLDATHFPASAGGQTVSHYQVDFTVTGKNGDNTAVLFYMK